MNNRARKTVHIAVLSIIFALSFVIFTILTFPYEVLKETIAAQVSKATGYSVQIGEMSVALPLGVSMENIHVDAQNGAATLDLKGIKARIGLLARMIGRFSVSLELAANKGELDVNINFGLIDLLTGKAVPRRLNVEAKNFPLDGLVNFALSAAASSPTANPMVAPLLSAVGVSGALNGSADFVLDSKDPLQSTGHADLQLANAILKLSHPSLGLPDQKFKKALVKAKVESGSVVIDKSSGFVADELELLADGKIVLKPILGSSMLDLKVVFRLNKGLKEKFGFLIDAMTGSATSEGQLTMQLRGALDQPAVTTF
jgi:type II secretion system protein N